MRTPNWFNQNWFLQNLQCFPQSEPQQLFVTDGSRIYDIPGDLGKIISKFQQGQSLNDVETSLVITALEPILSAGVGYINEEIIAVPEWNSVSINVAQACNMSCSYCYADEGKFKGIKSMMSQDVAFAIVDKLIDGAALHQKVLVGFMGGEPLLAKKLIKNTVEYAWEKAKHANVSIAFSITTNATLITEEDAAFFARYPFTVTVSMDGNEAVHDLTRRMQNGDSSYQKVLNGLQFLLNKRPAQLSARVTVIPLSGDLLRILDHLIALGFDEVGFSPVLVSPDPAYAYSAATFKNFTHQMIQCAEKALNEWLNNRPYPFSNLATAIEEIHKGTHRPYPCGAGAGYLSADTKGDLFACHRLIGDQEFAMGNIFEPIAKQPRKAILQNKHVDRQEPCNTCWARYLCGGGCYHEIKHRGRIACDHIREWLSYCLEAYTQISNVQTHKYVKQ